MTERTEKLPCPDCGIPVVLPVREDLTHDERLCNRCYQIEEDRATLNAYVPQWEQFKL